MWPSQSPWLAHLLLDSLLDSEGDEPTMHTIKNLIDYAKRPTTTVSGLQCFIAKSIAEYITGPGGELENK